jgi:hypothetical protein
MDKKMKSHKLQMIVLCLVAIAALFASSNANADTWNKATKISFPEPVEVSGIVLQSGTYWFQAPAHVLEQTPVKAVEPSGEEVEIAEVIEALPSTGSPLPLLGLLGLLAVSAGLGLRFIPARDAA